MGRRKSGLWSADHVALEIQQYDLFYNPFLLYSAFKLHTSRIKCQVSNFKIVAKNKKFWGQATWKCYKSTINFGLQKNLSSLCVFMTRMFQNTKDKALLPDPLTRLLRKPWVISSLFFG